MFPRRRNGGTITDGFEEYGPFKTIKNTGMEIMFSPEEKEQFSNKGYFRASDFVSDDVREKLFEELEFLEYEEVEQVREGHYGHVFASNIPNTPDKSEPYIAKFDMAKNVTQTKVLNEVWRENLVPACRWLTEQKAKYFLFPNVYRIRAGHHFRFHVDDFAGTVGYSYFINDGWKWDYGGILNYVFSEDHCEAIFPFDNSALLRNEEIKSYHFVPMVPDFVTKVQYLILGWGANDDRGGSKVRGDYHLFGD